MVEIIIKKRNKQRLSEKEINYFIDGYVNGSIPDYQMSSLLMAIFLNGMDDEETLALTKAMLQSGETIDLSSLKSVVIDKHSTGGVGDKTSIILAPLIAAAGVPIAKMSGRGLSYTGGTIDKLESIPGFSVEMSLENFVNQVKTIGIALTGQTANLVPADKKIYALRDVTGTVNNLSLIASSIMSKKLASGADGIVIDLKLGDGAFIKTLEEAEHLAKIMRTIASGMDKKLTVVITSMQEPLGNAIGNALEVKESIDVLKGKGPTDLHEVTLTLGTEMLLLSGKFTDKTIAYQHLEELINSGQAFEKLKHWIGAQGGNVIALENTDLLPGYSFSQTYNSKSNGYIQQIKASKLGLASVKLGAGREKKGDIIDFGAGIVLHKKVGSQVVEGENLATLYSNNEALLPLAVKYMDEAYQIGEIEP